MLITHSLIVYGILAFVLLSTFEFESCDAIITEADNAVAKETYKRVISCLKNGRASRKESFDWNKVAFPADAEEHYASLLSQTLKFRTNIKPHTYAGYSGPWMENHFIERFSSLPLSAFRGLIPIFVQWTDIHVHYFMKDKEKGKDNGKDKGILSSASASPMPNLPTETFLTLHKQIQAMLRPNVLYVAITQDDQGLFKMTDIMPNVLSMSAGGYGNIALPLIKGTLPYDELPVPIVGTGTGKGNEELRYWMNEVGFYGSLRQGTGRLQLLNGFMRAISQHGVRGKHLSSRPDWQKLVAHTMFNMAPRGFGRTSFRLYEIIQIGRLPIYMYDDLPWIPYKGTNISIENFAFLVNHSNLNIVAKEVARMRANSQELQARMDQVKVARIHYTYDGLMAQLDLFFRNPLGEGDSGGQLRCVNLPAKMN